MMKNSEDTVTVYLTKSGNAHLPVFVGEELRGTKCNPWKLSKGKLTDMDRREAHAHRCYRCSPSRVWR